MCASEASASSGAHAGPVLDRRGWRRGAAFSIVRRQRALLMRSRNAALWLCLLHVLVAGLLPFSRVSATLAGMLGRVLLMRCPGKSVNESEEEEAEATRPAVAACEVEVVASCSCHVLKLASLCAVCWACMKFCNVKLLVKQKDIGLVKIGRAEAALAGIR